MRCAGFVPYVVCPAPNLTSSEYSSLATSDSLTVQLKVRYNEQHLRWRGLGAQSDEIAFKFMPQTLVYGFSGAAETFRLYAHTAKLAHVHGPCTQSASRIADAWMARCTMRVQARRCDVVHGAHVGRGRRGRLWAGWQHHGW